MYNPQRNRYLNLERFCFSDGNMKIIDLNYIMGKYDQYFLIQRAPQQSSSNFKINLVFQFENVQSLNLKMVILKVEKTKPVVFW